MKIVLAEPRGFCSGVRRAVDILERLLSESDETPYVYHELVHNRHVVESFQARGVHFVDTLSSVPEGSTLLFSAHGVSPEIRSEAARRKLKTIDATCPLVARIHRQVRQFAEQDYQILLIGHRGHDEVVGTVGEAPDRITVLSTLEEADSLSLPKDARLACLMQTTLSATDSERIYLRLCDRFPLLNSLPKPEICRATQEHQDAIRNAIPDCDTVLVVGSANSSNTRRLFELAQDLGTRTFMVDGPDELNPDDFTGTKVLLVTSGASVPEELVRGTVSRLLSFHLE